eukprot:gene15222-20506_t
MDDGKQIHNNFSKITTHSLNSSKLIHNPSDVETLRHVHQFVRNDDEDENNKSKWEIRMARRYYDKLYKEYAIIDLSRFEEGMYGLRWRTEKEVLMEKGQNICGEKKCNEMNGYDSRSNQLLGIYELPFSYLEGGTTKCELVKVRLCKECSGKLLKRNSHLKNKKPKLITSDRSTNDINSIKSEKKRKFQVSSDENHKKLPNDS